MIDHDWSPIDFTSLLKTASFSAISSRRLSSMSRSRSIIPLNIEHLNLNISDKEDEIEHWSPLPSVIEQRITEPMHISLGLYGLERTIVILLNAHSRSDSQIKKRTNNFLGFHLSLQVFRISILRHGLPVSFN